MRSFGSLPLETDNFRGNDDRLSTSVWADNPKLRHKSDFCSSDKIAQGLQGAREEPSSMTNAEGQGVLCALPLRREKQR